MGIFNRRKPQEMRELTADESKIMNAAYKKWYENGTCLDLNGFIKGSEAKPYTEHFNDVNNLIKLGLIARVTQLNGLGSEIPIGNQVCITQKGIQLMKLKSMQRAT